ncbi:diguanylate cyclase (GGDEF) domain-containing protein [Marinobacter gudaonensis]|uniref:diguanylate cyclase n=2 Tax=Marinobacter gudaonensis TaxID=375760 RepID=A0A1I6G9W6_9GAMM|nr:diguanylate cyclase (GGDEF) domain-containing protein [Marinobacter gudaonensis]
MCKLQFMKQRALLYAIAALIVGVTLSLGLGRLLYKEETRAIELEFKAEIDQLSASLEREALLNLEILFALKSAVAVMPEMTAERFNRLTREILERSPAIQAFAWAPFVKRSELDEFVRRQEEAFAEFAMTEASPDGLVGLTDRAWYVPVQYIEPLGQNRAALGFDLASEASRREALMEARESGEMVATAGIRLVQEPENQRGFLVFAPLYSLSADQGAGVDTRRHYGFINGVFRVGELVGQAVGLELTEDLLFEVLDITGSQKLMLYRSRNPEHLSWQPDLRYTVESISIAGRRWSVEAVPSRSYIEARRGLLPVFVSASGTVLVVVLVGYFLSGARKNAQLRVAKAELERISLTDALTGLANRRQFDAVLHKEYRRALREKTTLSLVMVDIDFFKEYNDEYGHPAGDACLRDVGGILREVVKRPADLVTRYGGEEFAIILPDTPQPETIAEACRQAVEARGIPHRLSSVAESVTISVGVAMLAPGGFSASQLSPEQRSLKPEASGEQGDQPSTGPALLVDEADDALYRAKESGRNQVCGPFTGVYAKR